jgi:hypothetical protein
VLVYKAAHTSITHDEVSTYDYLHFSFWQLLQDPRCFGTANNHVLNTLLMKLSVGAFGTAEWALRLPNLLAFALFLGVAARWVLALSELHGFRWAAMLLLVVHPFMLDFFGLCRGYGLMLAFILLSLFGFYRYMKESGNRWATVSWAAAVLAVMSNFTALNFFVSLGAVWLLNLVGNWHNNGGWRVLLPPLTATVALALLAGKPIALLRSRNEFEWGAGQWLETVSHYLDNWSYVLIPYIGNGIEEQRVWHLPFFLSAMFVIVGLGLLGLIWSWFKNKRLSVDRQFFCLAALLPALVALGTVLQHNLFQTAYLDNRTAVLYAPLIRVCWVFLGLLLVQRFSRVQWPMLAFSLFLLYHFFTRWELGNTREWWYDRNSKAVITTLNERIPKGQQVSVGAYWIFEPAMSFYIRNQPLERILPIKYSKSLDTAAHNDYYIVYPDDARMLPNEYRYLFQIGDFPQVYKRDTLAWKAYYQATNDQLQRDTAFLRVLGKVGTAAAKDSTLEAETVARARARMKARY